MTVSCVICGTSFPTPHPPSTDICPDCFLANFSGAQPPLDVHAPTASEVLDAYVYPDHQITPRQAQALARMHVYWQRRQGQEDTP